MSVCIYVCISVFVTRHAKTMLATRQRTKRVTCDKVDAQIWVVYYAFRNKFTHPFIKVGPPHMWHQ